MEKEQIEKSLNARFAEHLPSGQKRRIIFWYDSEQQFVDLIDELQLAHAKVHRLTDSNYFYSKYLLEVEDPESNYLLYATSRPARDEDNWLLDILLYSSEFSANRVLLYMEELGIDSRLKLQVRQYEKFFKNSARRKRLVAYGKNYYDASELEIAMMSALCGLKFSDLQGVFKKVLGDSLETESNRYLSEINKYMDAEVFWRHATGYFGYMKEEASLSKLAAHVLVSSLSRNLDSQQLAPLKDYLAEKGRENCIFFVDQWMNHKSDAAAYERLAVSIEKAFNIGEYLEDLALEDLSQCDSFEAFDKLFLNYMRDSIIKQAENYDLCLGFIGTRRSRHWYYKYQHIYEALYYVFKILQFMQTHPSIPVLNRQELWQRYVEEYYFMDLYYRHFYWNYDQAPVEALKAIREVVENIYSNWFLEGLGTAWSAALTAEQNKRWSIAGVQAQQEFYKKELAPRLKSGGRCFVIISDALRYEVACELAQRLNAETAGMAQLRNMLGVLPSATKYGMAALLPHRELILNEKQKILADGNKTDSLLERELVLKKEWPEALATDFQTIIDLNKEQRRELIRGKKLIYLYHNSIDAIGDKAAAEIKVFDAARESIKEIYRLIRIIRDDLGGVNIYITADHGFLYKRDPLLESDKIKKETLGAWEEKRRYMLGYQEYESDALMMFKADYLQSEQGPPVVYVPRATIRFKVPGAGANYVHGGASLQEVVIPLIKYKAARGSNARMKEERKVKVKLVNESRKITNNLFSLDFFQTEKVGDRYLPRSVEVYLEDEAGLLLSNREIIIADRKSDKAAERTFKLRFTLKAGNYDKNKDYFLVIKDCETELIEDRILYKISLAISSDFDL